MGQTIDPQEMAQPMQQVQAETYARLDYHAYDEQARYLKDLIEQQLCEWGGCRFDGKVKRRRASCRTHPK